MGNPNDPVDCPLCGDTNARAIIMMRTYTYVCPDPRCQNHCPDRQEEISERMAKLLESSDELDFLSDGEEIYLPPSLTD